MFVDIFHTCTGKGSLSAPKIELSAAPGGLPFNVLSVHHMSFNPRDISLRAVLSSSLSQKRRLKL